MQNNSTFPLTCVSNAPKRWAVCGRSGSIFPGSIARHRRHVAAAGRRIVLWLGMKMMLRVGFLLQKELLLRERLVTAGRTPPGRCGTQTCQLRLKTIEGVLIRKTLVLSQV